ncbi:uncharacterized protein LOC114131387 [Aphis gossypii]|uniref:uncharacterized protein LOC114131387 n=1 Tax=Aphis gossypii TaxID=80765 RepID=UPI00215979DC|nr:uncharacterized protein LOC114131387 [Aphis gossypii]XP_050057806.1 uncharacterized protein LOC114131387 [Aphis gossypii]
MRGKWIFVLLCLSFFGELVLGSIFPPIPPPTIPPPSTQDIVPQQQEVNWPINTIATPEVMIVGETTLNTRGLHAEQIQQTGDRPLETSLKAEEILPKTIVIGTEQKTVSEIVTKNNEEMETKNLRPTIDNN